jgi:hypothetical protein
MMIMMLGVAVLIQAAQPVRIPDEPSCATCTITSRMIAKLEQPADDYGWPLRVRMDDKGRYWMIRELAPPVVFDAAGGGGKALGPKGKGPDEYAWAADVFFAGDSTIVIDEGNARAVVLGPSLKTARSVSKSEQLMHSVVIRWPTLVLANGSPYSRSADPLMKLVSYAGDRIAIAKSFGPIHSGGLNAMPRCAMHTFSVPATGTLWAAPTDCGYEFSEYRVDGTSVRRLERRPDWFPEGGRGSIGSPSRAPEPRLSAISRDDRGLLWLYIQIPRPAWKEGWPQASSGQREIRSRDIQLEKMYDMRIEVIDPAIGKVVARQSFPGYVLDVLRSGRVAFRERGVDGDEITVVREFTLTGR